MTQKEIANRLRKLIDATSEGVILSFAIQRIADEIDPPLPEPGTVVWWRDAEGVTEWSLGIVHVAHPEMIINDAGSHEKIDSVQWKPAHILAPDEVAVKREEAERMQREEEKS